LSSGLKEIAAINFSCHGNRLGHKGGKKVLLKEPSATASASLPEFWPYDEKSAGKEIGPLCGATAELW